MNERQKTVIALGLFATSVALTFAPHRVEWHTVTLERRSPPITTQRLALIFTGPNRDRVWAELKQNVPALSGVSIDRIDLDSGKTGLTLGIIAGVTVALVALASTRRPT